MKVFIFIVNYRADDCLVRFIHSISSARSLCPSAAVELHVLDNSRSTEQELQEIRSCIDLPGGTVTVHSLGTNTGYFGGLRLAQSLVPVDADHVIYSNPDVLVDPEFLVNLSRIRKTSCGVVAPAILSLEDGSNLNPMYRRRLSTTRLRFMQWIHAHRLPYAILNRLSWLKNMGCGWIRRLRWLETGSTPIYAAHGAFFMFADVDFFLRLPEYPCFLFGEELFVAEEARIAGVSVVYEPSLRVRDERHVSTGRLPGELKRLLALKSVEFILDRYYSSDRAAGS